MAAADGFTPSHAQLRSELARMQAECFMVASQARDCLDENGAAGAVELAAEQLARAFVQLEGGMRLAGETSGSWGELNAA